jgi:hypothetical protein
VPSAYTTPTFKERRHELAAHAKCERDGDGEKDQIHDNGEPAVMQAEAQDGQIYGLSDARNGIGALRPQTATDEHHHQYQYERDGENGR